MSLIERVDEFVDRVMMAGLEAGIRPAPAGQRGSPAEIVAAAHDIANGLDQIERGLGTIDAARRSTALAATARADGLRDLHENILRSIAAAVASALPTAIIRDADIDASAPSYAPTGFANRWRGAFGRAAGQVGGHTKKTCPEQLRAPKSRDEWFGRLVMILAEIYHEATGKVARSYARSQVVNEAWQPPFCKFVRDLWPIWADGSVDPSDSKIRDALRDASKLRPQRQPQ